MSYQFGQNLPEGSEIPVDFCNDPTDLSTAMTGNVVRFYWKAPHKVVHYALTVIEVGVSQQTFYVPGTSYIVRLKPNTSYQWIVTAICELDPPRQSNEVPGIPFVTGNYYSDCIPINPGDAMVALLPDKATFSWPAIPDAKFYELQYRPKGGFFPFTTVTPQTNSVSISHLVPNTVYEWRVRPICKEYAPDHWLDFLEFTTPVTEDQCPTPEVVDALISFNSLMVIWKVLDLHQTFNIFLDGVLYASSYRGNIYTFTNLQANTAYTITIVPNCAAGQGRGVSVTRTTSFGLCPLPSDVNAVWDNTNGIVVTWGASTGALNYEVVINGEKKTTTDLSVTLMVPQDGRKYFIQVRSVCGEGETITGYSPYVDAELTVPKVCPAIVFTNAPVVLSNSVFIDWNNQTGVLHWIVKWKRNIDADYNEGIQVENSEYKIEGLLPSTLYDIQVTSVCPEGTTDYNFQQTTPVQSGCPVPFNVEVVSVLHDSVLFEFEVPGNSSFGTFRVTITDGVNVITEDIFVKEAVIEGLEPDTEYTLTIQNRCIGGTFTTSTPVNFTTKRSCIVVSSPTASQAYGSPNVELSWLNTGLVDDFEIDIYSKLKNDPDDSYQLIASGLTGTSYTHVVGVSLIQQIRDYKIVTRDLEADEECSVEVQLNCPTVQNLKQIVEGNSATLSWDPVRGAIGYRVRVTSLINDPIVQFVRSPSIVLSDLGANDTYSWYVETVCLSAATGPFSEISTFTTEDGNTSEGDCSTPVFEAKSQSELFQDDSTGDPLPYVYWYLADNDTAPVALPSNSLQVNPSADITVNFGNVTSPKFFAILYKEADALVKTKYMDQNNTVNTGDIGNPGNLFNASTISIGGVTYRFIITDYATQFQGTAQTVRFFRP
jgi:hypothetical protein